jgi:hypothetical protein
VGPLRNGGHDIISTLRQAQTDTLKNRHIVVAKKVPDSPAPKARANPVLCRRMPVQSTSAPNRLLDLRSAGWAPWRPCRWAAAGPTQLYNSSTPLPLSPGSRAFFSWASSALQPPHLLFLPLPAVGVNNSHSSVKPSHPTCPPRRPLPDVITGQTCR